MWLHISVVSAGFTFRDSARSENRWSPSALVQVESEQGSFATPAPLAGNSPETAGNVGDYSVMQPTPRPAPFMGTFCRGGACQYRVQLPTDEPLPSHLHEETDDGVLTESCHVLAGLGRFQLLSHPEWFIHKTSANSAADFPAHPSRGGQPTLPQQKAC